MPAGNGPDEWLDAIDVQVLPELERFNPEFLLISAGFDSRHGDPLGPSARGGEYVCAKSGRVGLKQTIEDRKHEIGVDLARAGLHQRDRLFLISLVDGDRSQCNLAQEQWPWLMRPIPSVESSQHLTAM